MFPLKWQLELKALLIVAFEGYIIKKTPRNLKMKNFFESALIVFVNNAFFMSASAVLVNKEDELNAKRP